MAYGQNPNKPIARIPLVVPVESRYGSLNTDAKIINGFAEKDEGGEYDVYKRPGIASTGSVVVPNLLAGTGQVLVQTTGSGAIYSTYYVIQLFTVTYLGLPSIAFVINGGAAVVGGGRTAFGVPPFSASAVQTLPGLLLAATTGSQYVNTLNYTTSTITNTALVATTTRFVPGILWFDYRGFVMDTTATIWNSAIGDSTTWNGNSFIQATQTPGVGIGLAQHESLVVALKSGSVEFFYDAGVSPPASPLLPLPNSTINWGCVDGNTIQNIENKLYWLAVSSDGAYFVAQINQRQHTQISTPGVDRLLQGATGPYYSFSTKIMGHTFYGLTAVGANLTVVYDLREGLWYIWTDPSGNYFPYFGFINYTSSGNFQVNCLSIHESSPTAYNLYKFSQSVYTDFNTYSSSNGLFALDIYTPNYDSGSRNKDVLQRMDFIGDQQPGVLKSRWNDDDFAPRKWSNFRNVDMNQRRPTLLNNGTFRRRSWHFRWQEPYPFRLEGVELTLLPGTA